MPADPHAELEALLQDAVAQGVTPGCVALSRRDGQTQLHAAFGAVASHAAAPSHAAVTLDTIYDLASLTKVLATTTLLAQTVARGLLTLDTPLPRDLAPAGASLRLVDLLEHAAGLEAHREFFFAPFDLAPNQPQAMLAAIREVPLACPPRTRAIYTDLGFILLGAWLERVHALPLDALFLRDVAEPLGLIGQIGYRRLSATTSSERSDLATVAPTEVYDPALHDGVAQHWYRIRERVGQAVAHGVVHDDNCLILDGVAGHAGLFGTAQAVATIGQAWLDQALPGIDLTRSQQIVRRFMTPSTVPGSTRRLGFDGPEPDGGGSTGGALSPRAYGHLGFTGTSVWIDPERRAVHVLLSNRVHPIRDDNRIRALRPSVHRLAARL